MKILRNKVTSENGFIFRSTRTSSFIKFLVKICFIPVTVTKEKIIFKIFHWRTLTYLILLIGYVSFFYFTSKCFNIFNNFHFNNGTEMISVIVVGILALILRIIPLILSFGLQKMNPTRFQNKTHRKPKQTTKIIVGMNVKKMTLTFLYFF